MDVYDRIDRAIEDISTAFTRIISAMRPHLCEKHRLSNRHLHIAVAKAGVALAACELMDTYNLSVEEACDLFSKIDSLIHQTAEVTNESENTNGRNRI